MAEVQNIRVTSRGEDGSLVFRSPSGEAVHVITDDIVKQNLSSSATMGISQSGTLITCTTDVMIYTLNQASTQTGVTYTFINGANTYGALGFQVQANTTNGFVGGGIATAVVGSRLTLVKATSQPGDYVSIYNGGSTTWCVAEMAGIWTNT